MADIRDAAQRNGVPVEAVEKRANSAVRGQHYNAYFKAYQKGDERAMSRESDALERLDVSSGAMQRSLNRREKLEPSLNP